MTYPTFHLVTKDRTWGQPHCSFDHARKALVAATAEGMDLEIIQVITTVVLRSKDIPASELDPPPATARGTFPKMEVNVADIQNADELIAFIERIERVEDEIKGLVDDRKDIYAKLKAQGYHTKFVRALVALRAIDPEKRKENDQLMAMYREATGLA